MGKYMRKCKEAGELAVMEVGPLTRARKMVLLEAAAEAKPRGRKLRKVDGAEFVLGSGRLEPERAFSRRNPGSAKRVPSEEEECLRSDRNVGLSRCSSNGSCEQEALGQFRSAPDLEAREGFGAEEDFDSRHRILEATPSSSNHRSQSDELDSATTTAPSEAANSRPKLPPVSAAATAVEMPPAAEIDAFFTAAEKREQRRFAEKYNYDVEKDAPLEGRYEWVRLR